MPPSKKQCYRRSNVVCPYCGHEHCPWYDLDDTPGDHITGEGDHEPTCNSCKKTFRLQTQWKDEKLSPASQDASPERTHPSYVRDSLDQTRQCSQSLCQSDICVHERVREEENTETTPEPPDCGKPGGKPVEKPDSTGGIPGEAECRRRIEALPEVERLQFESSTREAYKWQMGKEPRKQEMLAMFGCVWWKRQRQGLPFAFDVDEYACLELAIGACAEKEQVGALKSFPAYLKGIYKTWVHRQTFTVKQIEENQRQHDGGLLHRDFLP